MTDLIPGSGRFPGGMHGNPFQYSCQENPMGRVAQVGYTKSSRIFFTCKKRDKDFVLSYHVEISITQCLMTQLIGLYYSEVAKNSHAGNSSKDTRME